VLSHRIVDRWNDLRGCVVNSNTAASFEMHVVSKSYRAKFEHCMAQPVNMPPELPKSHRVIDSLRIVIKISVKNCILLTSVRLDVDVSTINQFKARLDKFWLHQDILYDYTAGLTGIGDRSVHVTKDE